MAVTALRSQLSTSTASLRSTPESIGCAVASRSGGAASSVGATGDGVSREPILAVDVIEALFIFSLIQAAARHADSLSRSTEADSSNKRASRRLALSLRNVTCKRFRL